MEKHKLKGSNPLPLMSKGEKLKTGGELEIKEKIADTRRVADKGSIT